MHIATFTRRFLFLPICLILSSKGLRGQSAPSAQPASDGIAESAPRNMPAVLPLPTSRSTTVQSIKFVRGPTWRRIRQERDVWLGGGVVIKAVVATFDKDNRPVSGIPVKLFVQSPSGPIGGMRGQPITDNQGEASAEVTFDVSPGAIRIIVQACAAEDLAVCTPAVTVSLKNWLDVSTAVDLGFTTVPRPENGAPETDRTVVPLTSFNSFQSVFSPRIQCNVWEREENFKYVGFSVYTTVPIIFQDHSVASLFGSQSVDRGFGMGDYAVGANLQLYRELSLDTAFNGRSGRLNLLDSFRVFGNGRPVNLGDGFQSIDMNLTWNRRFRPRAVIITSATASRSFVRRFDNGDRGEQGDFYQLTGGLGILRHSRDFGFVTWGAYARAGGLRLTQAGKTTAILESGGGFQVGISYADLRGGPASARVGAYVGGLGGRQIYVGINLTLDFRALLFKEQRQ